MDLLSIALIASTLLCSLVAGIVFTFASVAMPGLRKLDDRGFLRAFQAMDRVIQDNQPAFMVVWVGSVIALVVTAGVGFGRLEGVDRMLLILATAVSLLGVHLPTATINVPLNSRLQTQDLDTMTDASIRTAREAFEHRWVRWNLIRTVFAIVVSLLLMTLAVRLGGPP
jgi:uncharacterized membrane protein